MLSLIIIKKNLYLSRQFMIRPWDKLGVRDIVCVCARALYTSDSGKNDQKREWEDTEEKKLITSACYYRKRWHFVPNHLVFIAIESRNSDSIFALFPHHYVGLFSVFIYISGLVLQSLSLIIIEIALDYIQLATFFFFLH